LDAGESTMLAADQVKCFLRPDGVLRRIVNRKTSSLLAAVLELLISAIPLLSLYVFWAGPSDQLPAPELGFYEEGEHVD
jgi:hypothetical protein